MGDEEDVADTDLEPSEYIHPMIDEEELADAIKLYTDGEFRDSQFNKKKSTFESYKHVADYFQESVFDFLDPYLK